MARSTRDRHNFSLLRKNVLSAAAKLDELNGASQVEFSDGVDHKLGLHKHEIEILLPLILHAAVVHLGAEGCRRLATVDVCSGANQTPEDQLFRLTNYCLDSQLNLRKPTSSSQRNGWHQFISDAVSEIPDTTVLGYAYQFFCHPVRATSKKLVQTANKSTQLRDVIGFTQLYTPDWVASFLLANTLLPAWKGELSRLHPNFCQFKLPGQKGTNAAENLQLIDPSAGSGHLLLIAFDLFLQMYEAENIPALEAIPHIVQHNLTGCDIDIVGLWICALGLVCKALKQGFKQFDNIKLRLYDVQSASINVPESSGDLGSLSRNWPSEHALNHRYDAVVGNPPYLGRKLLSRSLKQQLKLQYPNSHQDLCAAFMTRGLELLKPHGRLGYISQTSLMFLPTYTNLRRTIIEENHIDCVVEVGPHIFPLQNGEKVNSALYVLSKLNAPGSGVFVNLTDTKDKAPRLASAIGAIESKRGTENVFFKSMEFFQTTKNNSWLYQCPERLPAVLQNVSRLAEHAEVRQGLATTDNERFVRYWWQVDQNSIGKTWFPYAKGAGSERWFSPIQTVVFWENNGEAIKDSVNKAYPYLNGKTAWVVKNEQFYFKEGLTFSFINSQHLAVRHLPQGCIFDVAGSAIFPADNSIFGTMAYINSSFVGAAASQLNPTINFQVGDLKELPVLPLTANELKTLEELGREAWLCKSSMFAYCDLTHSGITPAIRKLLLRQPPDTAWDQLRAELKSCRSRLSELENEIDSLVMNAVQLHTNIDSSTYSQLVQITSRKGEARPKAQSPVTDEKDFVRLFIAWHLYALIADGQTTFRISDLGISPYGLSWLEAQVQLRVETYLTSTFNAVQSKRFRSHPRALCQSGSEGLYIIV